MPAARKFVTPETPRLAIVYRPTASLIPDARNARTHSPEQIAELVASYREFGWTNPVLIDDKDGIVAGHGRVLMAHAVDLVETPCIVLAHLTPAQRRAYMLADNKLAQNSGWDEDLLRSELTEIVGSKRPPGDVLESLGFSVDELRNLVFPIDRKAVRAGRRGLSDGLSYQVVVECRTEGEQTMILEELRGRGVKCKPLIL